jgi:uncharacterized protein YPO0396
LLNRLGQLRETFPDKITKGVAFSPLTNIRDFVHNYLLDENLVDVKTLQQQLESLRHFEGLVADIRARIAELDRIDEYDEERVARRRLRITNGFVRRRGEADRVLEQLKDRRLERDEDDLALKRAELARDGLQESLKLAHETLMQAQIALKTDATAARQRELGATIAEQSDRLEALRRQEQDLLASVAGQAAAAASLRDLLASDLQPVPPALDAFVAQASAGWTGDASNLLAALRDLGPVLDTLGQSFADRRALLIERMRLLREEGERLQREITQLQTGKADASYEAEAPAAARLRRLLRAELGLGPDDVIYLCQALQVADEGWQDAVEGALGAARFHLLVPRAHYEAAIRLYRDRRFRDQLHGVGLPDGDRILQAAAGGEIRSSRTDRLATEVEADSSLSTEVRDTARAYVDLLLGGYVKCDTLEALRDHRMAITRECFVRRNYSTSHLDPAHYRRWFLGERAIPRQIQEREARLAAIATELAEVAGQVAGLDQRLALTRDRARLLINLERDLPALASLPALAATLAAHQAELAGLDTQTLVALQAAADRAASERDALQSRLGEAEHHIGSLETRLQALDRELIPALERDIATALQGAQLFLQLEDASDMLEEVEKEYGRRRERQALQTVVENAARYEGEYGAAEGKSRDRLREAKQAYSLRFDFGYDEQEDAGRYRAERERYIASELPDYEARVAHQRALAEQELVENFIHRLREQIEDARSQLEHLNMTLKRLLFGGERYEFVAGIAPDLREVYDMVMDSQAVLGTSLFESDFRRKHQEGWDRLFERLTIGPDDELAPELRQLQDYRNYLTYDIRIHYPNGDRALHSQVSAKKSGGETTTPFYVAMAASFAQAYRLNQPRPSDTIRLAIFDEAFGKMDTARTASALKFMVDTGLQVLLATPPDKAGGLLPYVDSVRTIVRQNNHSFVLEIDKCELVQKAAPEA